MLMVGATKLLPSLCAVVIWGGVMGKVFGVLVGLIISLGMMPIAEAQTGRLETSIQRVYERLPQLPKENQYRSLQSKQVDPNNTFVNRLVRYHVYVKGRPGSLRLDWKHTIADYLDANETIDPDSYPTQNRLTTNPLPGDRAVIVKMSRQERSQLVQTLVETLGQK
jgi:hypothetical protein